MDRFHPGHVESGMNPHGPRELKPHRRPADEPPDGKKALKPWLQLPGLHQKWQVPGEEPHPVANLVGLCGVTANGAQGGCWEPSPAMRSGVSRRGSGPLAKTAGNTAGTEGGSLASSLVLSCWSCIRTARASPLASAVCLACIICGFD